MGLRIRHESHEGRQLKHNDKAASTARDRWADKRQFHFLQLHKLPHTSSSHLAEADTQSGVENHPNLASAEKILPLDVNDSCSCS